MCGGDKPVYTKSIRLTQIDTAKFIAIFLVIVSHSSMTSTISPLLFAFHVQLFFICYGYVYKDKGLSFKQFIDPVNGGGKILIIRLLFPFFLLCLIFGPPLSIPTLIRLIYGRTAGMEGTAHLWFLPCFFLSAILFQVINIVLRLKNFSCFLVFVFLGFISSVLDYESGISFNVGSKILHFTGYGTSDSLHLYWGFPYTMNV